jgi:hypothetical protein
MGMDQVGRSSGVNKNDVAEEAKKGEMASSFESSMKTAKGEGAGKSEKGGDSEIIQMLLKVIMDLIKKLDKGEGGDKADKAGQGDEAKGPAKTEGGDKADKSDGKSGGKDVANLLKALIALLDKPEAGGAAQAA